MLRTRVIPCLLLQNLGLVKTIRFGDPKYVGDPINAVRIFNDKEVDELVFLDISATPEKKKPPFEMISQIAGECFMPLCYGGGVRTLEEMKTLFALGVEKVCLNTRAVQDPGLVEAAARSFGSQSVVVAIDVKKSPLGGYQVFTHGGRKNARIDPVTHAVRMEAAGAGELLVNSIDRDGTMEGYDIDLIRSVTRAVSIPVVACGGAGSLEDLRSAVRLGGAAAVAAGSLFVFNGRNRAVLINYPEASELEALLAGGPTEP